MAARLGPGPEVLPVEADPRDEAGDAVRVHLERRAYGERN